jgi:hypothetical protein
MVTLTPEIAGNSLVIMGIVYAVMAAFSIYQLYLNWKQSKVNNQMTELLKQVTCIQTLLKDFIDWRMK